MATAKKKVKKTATRKTAAIKKAGVIAAQQPEEAAAASEKAKAKKTAAPSSNCDGGAKGPEGPGVISTIIATISRDDGASADECLEVLKKAFPERNPELMIKTVRIQANKQKTSKQAVDGRGLVYYKAAVSG